MAQIHVCGQCNEQFETEKLYIDHICEVTGKQPSNPEHLGAAFIAQSEAALKRGEARKNPEAPSVVSEVAEANE